MVFLAFNDEITYEQLSFDKLPPEFSHFNIFFIADIHRRKIKDKTLNKIEKQVHAVFIGGDLVERGVSLKRMRNNILKLKRWRRPVYFVWGNNDYEVNEQALTNILHQENVIILKDEVIELDHGKKKLNIIGFNYSMIDDMQPSVNWETIDDSFTILLTHHPYSFQHLAADQKEKIDLAFAGHTHGGQIRIFGFGFYTKGGIFKENNSTLFVTEGYGYSLLPLRLQTRAQCHVITILNHDK